MIESMEGINLYLWTPIILVSVLAIAALFYRPVAEWLASTRARKKADIVTLYEIIEDAGYTYDPKQDIFYANMNSWQRKMGYCRLYDEASAPLNMIIDCEPIHFSYGGKRWLIEFWKGQYGMTTGGEIGVYTTEEPDLNIPGFFEGTFYKCASDADRLYMSYSLVKDGELLFARKGRHWWLTGFKLGEFSEPSDLIMYLSIVLEDAAMRNAFVEGLRKAGYSRNEIFIEGNIVSLVFDEPRTPQPITRVSETDWLIQRKNELLCDRYQKITGPYDDFSDKMNAIREQAPEIYDAILNIGKTKPLFAVYEKIKDYLGRN
ncbi:MAG: DUF4474 domain-containing protein [Clostridia bacterium]